VTLGLLAALRGRGVAVRAAKVGPDYIDPAFHEAATGRASINLDGWAMPGGMLTALAAGDDDGSLLVVEAAMGLFDGAGRAGPGGTDGSAAALARTLGLPVLLVLDVSGQAQSAGAVALGFASMDPLVRIGGVVLNQVASPRHRARAESGVVAAGLAVMGALGRSGEIGLSSRHLGLVGAGEHEGLAALLETLGGLVGAGVDLDAVCAMADPVRAGSGALGTIAPPGQRIALARDAAFAFCYPHMMAGWRAAGAEIVPFSPLANEGPHDACDAVWLPGGYPELHAGRLAGADGFLGGLRAAAVRGAVVHGECGGLMVLGQGLVDADGARHAMAGLLDGETSFAARRMQLGYRSARLLAGCALGPVGAVIAGHEFHYATVSEAGRDVPMAMLHDAEGEAIGPAGAVRGLVSGSFFHAIARHG
jgi:cobyrinic acid a,c-diamide synthase